MAFEVFISYSHQDQAFRQELDKHLSNLKRQQMITAWYDGDISPGTDWQSQIIEHLNSAEIILLLVSADFMASDFCYSTELTQAIARHDAGQVRVIPILLRPTDWQGAPFAKLKMLPTNAKAVTSWPTRDDAFNDVVVGIRKAVEDLKKRDQGATELQQSHYLHKVDWGDAPDVSKFYGRQPDLTALEQWMLIEHCRLIALLGVGGIGKTTLASKLVHQTKNQFKYVIWRSMNNPLPLRTILQDCIELFSDQQQTDLPEDIDRQISRLIEYLRQHRCLIILDSVESLLQSGSRAGYYQKDFEDYEKFFQRIGESSHQSCLLLTSREKPREIARLEGDAALVRSRQLAGLEQTDGRAILQNKGGLHGNEKAWNDLVDHYAGNPLALQLVAQHIKEVFNGDVAAFLRNAALPRDIRDLLNQQFERLLPLEQDIMYWLAIEREAVSLDDMQKNILRHIMRGELEEHWSSLRRRSLVEPIDTGFTLQDLLMEYVLDRFIQAVLAEIDGGDLLLFESHALMKAQAKDYIRESQERLILKQVANQLQDSWGEEEIKKKFSKLLSILRTTHQHGYAAGNIVNLLVQLGYNLSGFDFSYLTLRQAYLESVPLQEVNFAYANLGTSVFTNTFGNIFSVAYSPTEELIAVGTTIGEILLWNASDGTPIDSHHEHTDGIRSVAFSPDGTLLASASDDQTIRIWNVNSGLCLHTFQGHSGGIRSVAFSPDGTFLASASNDKTVRIWKVNAPDPCIETLSEHTNRVMAVAFSPDGNLLASGSSDQSVRIWELSTGRCVHTLRGHNGAVRSVAFVLNPQGLLLASGSDDMTIHLWQVHSGTLLSTLQGHTDAVRAVAFSNDGSLLASASEDKTIRVWEIETGQCTDTLQGHSSWVRSIAFSPNSKVLVSGGEDQTIRFWQISSGRCLRTLKGYAYGVRSVAFHPVGSILASGGTDQNVRLWEAHSGQHRSTLPGHSGEVRSVAFSPDGQLFATGSGDTTVRIWVLVPDHCLRTLREHTNRVRSVAFNHDGSMLASGSDDKNVCVWQVRTGRCIHHFKLHTGGVRLVVFNPVDDRLLASGSNDHTIRIWDVSKGQCIHVLEEHISSIRSIAYSHDGRLLASGSSDNTVRIWEISSGKCLYILSDHIDWIRSVAFSPDDKLLASGSNDKSIRIWNTGTGECIRTLEGHTHRVRSVAFSGDGQILASGSDDKTIKLWNTASGRCLHTLFGHTNSVRLVTFSPDEVVLASGSSDGTIRLWNVYSGKLLHILESDRLYERMNITHVQGLTEVQEATLRTLGAISN